MQAAGAKVTDIGKIKCWTKQKNNQDGDMCV